jgi:hypothetical protein
MSLSAAELCAVLKEAAHREQALYEQVQLLCAVLAEINTVRPDAAAGFIGRRCAWFGDFLCVLFRRHSRVATVACLVAVGLVAGGAAVDRTQFFESGGELVGAVVF